MLFSSFSDLFPVIFGSFHLLYGTEILFSLCWRLVPARKRACKPRINKLHRFHFFLKSVIWACFTFSFLLQYDVYSSQDCKFYYMNFNCRVKLEERVSDTVNFWVDREGVLWNGSCLAWRSKKCFARSDSGASSHQGGRGHLICLLASSAVMETEIIWKWIRKEQNEGRSGQIAALRRQIRVCA